MTFSSPSGSSARQGATAGLDAWEIPGGWAERTLVIASHRLTLLTPNDPNEFLNQLDESAEPHVADPYWSAIWSAAPRLAERVAGHRWPAGIRTLELGCGVGLAGLAALAAGAAVTFSDYIETAVAFALENARRNGFAAATGLVLDWRNPPVLTPFPLVLASDVLYEPQLHEDLLQTLDHVLADDGQCWIGDPRRHAATDFATRARQRGYEVTIDDENRSPDASTPDSTFQLLIVRRRPA